MELKPRQPSFNKNLSMGGFRSGSRGTHSPPPLLWNYGRFEKNSFQNKCIWTVSMVFCTPISEFSGSAPVFIVWFRQAILSFHICEMQLEIQCCSNTCTCVIVYPVIIHILLREQMGENFKDLSTKHSTFAYLCYLNMISLLPYVLGVVQSSQSIPC